jgi:hypothetical protein
MAHHQTKTEKHQQKQKNTIKPTKHPGVLQRPWQLIN